MKVKESLNVTFDESPSPLETSPLEDDDLVEEEDIKVSEKKPLGNDVKDETLAIDEIVNIKEYKSHPLENKFGLEDSKPMKTPMSSDMKLMKDEEGESVDNTKYRGMIVYVDSDHAGDYVDQKSTSGICTFMGCCLTSWFSKKQTALAISTTEAEKRHVNKHYG
uniref:Copia protein n=1 Tax=Tanacetum cinerariifolium TaxID=118510 RepID=A0A6L2L8N5_TANCI|nr:copia protein [Tanacetum cinerariifolium]